MTGETSYVLTQLSGPPGSLSFDRYTDRARRVLVLAQEDARSMDHAEITTGHLLTGMLGEGEAVAFRALDALGVTAEAARAALFDLAPPGGTAVTTASIPFGRDARKALELALREALQLGHNYIGTEHLLLGLVRDAEGASAPRVLATLGVPLPEVRAKVLELLHGYARREQPRVEPMTRLRQSLTTRQGRKVSRMLYEQVGDEPADDDPIIGLVDTPELAALIVAAVNAYRPEDG